MLVGGRARRLGGLAKPLLDVGGCTILARQAEALAALGVTPMLVGVDPAPYRDLGFPFVADRAEGGALAGLYTALAATSAPHVLVLAGDLPFVTAPFLGALVARRVGTDAVVPRSQNRWHPLCAVYDCAILDRVRRRLEKGERRVVDLLDEIRVTVVTDDDLARLDPDRRLLLNVNTPDDYRHATRLVTSGG